MTMTLDGSGANTIGVPNSAAAQTASGTAVNFTGIPAGVKRITVMLSGVSTNGTGNIRVQLGTSGGYVISGYNTMTATVTTTANTTGGGIDTTGFVSAGTTAATVAEGQIVFNLIGSNIWTGSGMFFTKNNSLGSAVGSVSLGGTLDRVRVIASTTGNPADTFDAGSINILYE